MVGGWTSRFRGRASVGPDTVRRVGSLSGKGRGVGGRLSKVVVAGVALVATGMLAGCGDDGDGGGWSTCSGYREDVSAGSAQDVRDLENGRNPCY